MPAKYLTDASIKSDIAKTVASARRVDIRDSVARGLVLRITPAGAATFVFTYRPRGERINRRIVLGRYLPDNRGMGLGEARGMADEHRKNLSRNVDPIQNKRAVEADKAALEKAERSKASRLTFGDLAEEYIRERIPKETNRIKARRLFAAELLPTLGAMAAADVTPDHAAEIWRKIMKRGAKTQARHAFSAIRAALNYAVDVKLMPASPLQGSTIKGKIAARERILSVDEIRTFLAALPTAPLPDDHKAILHLQLLLGQRISEVAGIERGELNLAKSRWTIPAERSKNRKATVVPLPPKAATILAMWLSRTKGQVVFPNRQGIPHENTNIATRVKASQGHFEFVDAKGRPNPFTTHDLRRTCATGLRQLKVSSDVRDAILNHVSARKASVTEGSYTFADLQSEKYEALARWQHALDEIVAGRDPFDQASDDVASINARVFGNGSGSLRVVA